MSHELTIRANGAVEFAYLASDGAPWHGLGKPMGADATIDQWRVDAGMDWEIKRSRVRYGNETNFRTIDDQHVLFRSDDKSPLGIVSKSYKVVQPGEVLEFFRDIVRAGGLELSAAGTIQGGKRFWATAKIGEAAPTSVQDKIGGYLLLSTSADGSLATEARLTSIRVVCKNTLQFAREDAKPALRVTHRSVFDAQAVRESMGLNSAAWDAFRHNLVRLANVQLHETEAAEIVAGLFATGTGELQRDKARETAGFQKVIEQGHDLPASRRSWPCSMARAWAPPSTACSAPPTACCRPSPNTPTTTSALAATRTASSPPSGAAARPSSSAPGTS